MQAALALAEEGARLGEVRWGAVLVPGWANPRAGLELPDRDD